MPRKWLIGAAVLLVAACLVAALLSMQFLRWADSPLQADADLVINFAAGESLATLAEELVDAQYLHSARRFVLLGRLTGADTRLQAGEYLFNQSATPRQLLNKLTQGEVIRHAFRIEEGITVQQLLAQLRKQPALQQTLQAHDARSLAAALGLTELIHEGSASVEGHYSAEGLFFPDTYQFTRGHTDVQLLQRAAAALEATLQDIWQNRSERSVLKNQYELLILASIIEKETGRAEDRQQISQVFHKRLADNMRLQTDPTVIYALGEDFDGDLIRDHLQVESPFNTYRNRGLPPTPIATVSEASLYAAAHPAPGDYVYFVAKGDGASQFSRTLAEHNKAVRKYQLGLTE
ncbi:MAG: endolytic transglycosylase MltG [bacterium]